MQDVHLSSQSQETSRIFLPESAAPSKKSEHSLERRSLLNDNYRQFHSNGVTVMLDSQLVQAYVNGEVKKEAAAVLAAMGLTVADAVRLLLTRVASEKALPFAPLVPNATTIAAMKEARAGNLPQFKDVQDLFGDLHAND